MNNVPFQRFRPNLPIIENGMLLQILFQFGDIVLFNKFLNFISGPFGQCFLLFNILD